MTQNEILDGNKMIAEFMGTKPNEFGMFNFRDDIYCSMTQPYIRNIDLQFDTSWDWLMPVVEKMNTMGQWTQLSYKELTGYWFEITTPRMGFAETGKNAIESVWKTVVKFIKWYNQNSKP